MAITAPVRAKIRSVLRFGLTTANADRLASFYESAFGCRRVALERCCGAEFGRLMGVETGATRMTLMLGNEIIELLQFDEPGLPYPTGGSSFDLAFQHFAIVVTEMEEAFHNLAAIEGWTAITSDGPQHLPARSGGVTAFKFRDPDGHPLELLAFDTHNVPPRWRAIAGSNLCLGIDHSAISVADSGHSIHFYEGLGFKVKAHSVNTGVEQERLDAVRAPHVEVTALTPIQTSPHIELLCYRGVRRRPGDALRSNSNDVAATRLVFGACLTDHSGADMPAPCAVRDPDGHHILIVAPLTGSTAGPDPPPRKCE